MITAQDITSRCPVSERPSYVIFRRSTYADTGEPFWSAVTRASDQREALFKANIQLPYNPAHDCFILATTFAEAINLTRMGLHFTDAEIAIYRSPYATAAE